MLVVGWGQHATSAAFGDTNGDGKANVVTVSPAESAGRGSVVRFFLNHDGKFADKPDDELTVPQVDQPHKVRVTQIKTGPFILVAGKTAALLAPQAPKGGAAAKGKLPTFSIVPFDLGDANHLRFVDESRLVSRRFGGFDAPTPPG